MVDAGEPVTNAYLADASWAVDVGGTRYPAIASMSPLYDPTNARIRT